MRIVLPLICVLAALLVSGCVTETGSMIAGPACPEGGPCCGNDVCELDEGPGSCPQDCVCIPGERRCLGDRPMECARTGRYWIFRETCGNGCGNGECMSGTYYDDALGFGLEYPEGWKVIRDYEMMGVNYTAGFFGPAREGFEPSILVKTEDRASAHGLEGYAGISQEALAGDFSGDGYELLDEGVMTTAGGLDAYFIRYSLNYTGIPVMGGQVFIRDQEGRFYIIIYTDLQGGFDPELFRGVALSFRLGIGESGTLSL